MQINGNTILITGGGSGIGRALAEAFHVEGNQVVIAGRRKELLDQTTAANPGMKSAILDIEDSSSIKSFADQIKVDSPSLNVVIHNAGIMRNEFVVTGMTADAEATIATNSARSYPSDGGPATTLGETAPRSNHDGVFWARVRAPGDEPDLLRNKGGDPFLYSVTTLPAEEHLHPGA